MKERDTLILKTDYITLGQALKFFDIIQTGGEEKTFLSDNDVYVNGEIEKRRGRKLRGGDTLEVEGKTYKICSSQN